MRSASMIITNRSLPRRTFLRGLGATVSLPLLDAMVPAPTATALSAAAPVHRVGFIYIGNGAIADKWVPSAEGRGFPISPILASVEPFKDQLFVPSGLDHKAADP